MQGGFVTLDTKRKFFSVESTITCACRKVTFNVNHIFVADDQQDLKVCFYLKDTHLSNERKETSFVKPRISL